MAKNTYHAYIVKVRDPESDDRTGAIYPHVRAVSDQHAERQGRDAFCGLLGVNQEQYDRLEVEVNKIPD